MNKKESWKKAVKDRFDFEAQHLNLSHSTWIMESWKKEQYPELKNNKHLLHTLDKLHKELAESKQNEGPISRELIAGKNHFIQRSISKNILTNLGMNEMGRRSTGESSTTNDYHAIGTGTTTETISDTILETEVGRKIMGTKTTVNQTERYATSFNDTDLTVSAPQFISEAGIFSLLSGGILIMRVTAQAPVELDFGLLVSILTNVTHQNGIEI